MDRFYYENQGTNTYLVYEIGVEDGIDTMALGMLANNRIPGLAPTLFMQMDTTKYIKYNVSAKVSASQLFSGSINQKRLLGVFSGIADAMLSAEDYMIDPKMILLDLEHIFVDVSTCETILICLPLANAGDAVDLGSFFKNIMFSTKFDQTENCDYVAKIINYLNSAPVFSIADFKNVIDGLKGQGYAQNPAPQPAPQYAAPQSQPVAQPPVQPQAPVQPQIPVQPQAPVQQQAAQPFNGYQGAPARQNPAQPQPAPTRPAQTAQYAPQTMQVPPTGKPGQTQGAAPAQTAAAAGDTGEKISLFYLLQHYNKDNAALYKAQKEAAKGEKTSTEKPKKDKKDKKQKQAGPQGFAVPGAPANPGFAVPGQKAPVQPAAPAQPARNAQPAYQPVAQPVAQRPYQPVAQQPAPAPQPQVQQPAAPAFQPQVQQPAAPAFQPQAPQMNFGETTVLGGGGIGETTVLGGGQAQVQPKPHLIRAKNNERIELNKPVFRIGKERSYVDYFVGDNPAVSRGHANIVTKGSDYFVVDTNSTNHTYVNGGMIQSNTEVKLAHGTKIRLANEEFEFRLY